MSVKKTAIVLFNLGGPDNLDAVKPFLFNLFHDPAIISVPQPLRWLLAKLISSRRDGTAREIYQEMGGGSPIVENTMAQARALEAVLNEENGEELGQVRCFIAMRYWHPFSDEAAAQVRSFGADQVILLPLYPQYSTTTTASSVRDWHRAARKAGITARTSQVCCYPANDGFVSALADLVEQAYAGLAPEEGSRCRLLFSAHGLPRKVIEKGDPYQSHVENTVASVVNKMAERGIGPRELDYQICYQSRVGPLEWIGPSTDDEVERAGRDAVPLILVPVAFVSEHSETLVELDIEYRELAEKAGVPAYVRVPTVDAHRDFIAGLAGLVRAVAGSEDGTVYTDSNRRNCGKSFGKCAQS